MQRFLFVSLWALLLVSCSNNELQKQHEAVVADSLRKSQVNDSIKNVLAEVLKSDQEWRTSMDDSGWNSEQRDSVIRNGVITDSLNLIKVEQILQKFGWIGPDVAGESSEAIFLSIQHSNLKTQEKYFLMAKRAAEEKKLSLSSLALLIDRIATSKGEDQLYGSQLTGWSNGKESGTFLLPVADPENIDKRRAEMGLEPIADYIKAFGLEWNLEKMKKEWADYKRQTGSK